MRLGCVFGCNLVHPRKADKEICKDEESHYLECPLLWGVVHDITGSVHTRSAVERLGCTNHMKMKDTLVAHAIYHHIKLGHRGLVLSMARREKWAELTSIAMAYGKCAAEDIG